MLNTQGYLMLHSVRLKPHQIWEQEGQGLVFFFVKSGCGKFTAKNVTHSFAPGDILVFDQTAGPKIAVLDNPGELCFLAFSVSFDNLLPLFACSEIGFLHNVVDSFKVAKIYPSDIALALECHRLLDSVPSQISLDHRGQLIRIAATILSGEFKERRNQQSRYLRTEDHMVEVLERLSASEVINLSVGQMATKFSCSRRHLNRLFHLHFGASLASLKMEMRLLKAISLLRDPDVKIIDVAAQCGFNHLGLFNTCFKRRFGLSPGRWRQSNNQRSRATACQPADNKNCPLQFNGLCALSGRGKPDACALPVNVPNRRSGKIGRAEESEIQNPVFATRRFSC